MTLSDNITHFETGPNVYFPLHEIRTSDAKLLISGVIGGQSYSHEVKLSRTHKKIKKGTMHSLNNPAVNKLKRIKI